MIRIHSYYQFLSTKLISKILQGFASRERVFMSGGFYKWWRDQLNRKFSKRNELFFHDICTLTCLLNIAKPSKLYKGVEHLGLRIFCKIAQDFLILTIFIIHASLEQIQVCCLMAYIQVSSKIRTFRWL